MSSTLPRKFWRPPNRQEFALPPSTPPTRKLRTAMPFETPNTAPATEAVSPSPSGFGPLRVPLFRDRWIASTVSSVGTWMQDTAGTWLMTSLTSSPLLIALMQTAASLPVLFLGLLAGATADVFDRRKLLIFWQVWMLASVAILAVLTLLPHLALGAAQLHLPAQHRLRHEQSRLAGHRPRARPPQSHPRHRLAQLRL